MEGVVEVMVVEVDLVLIWRVVGLELLLDDEDEMVDEGTDVDDGLVESRGTHAVPRSPVLLKESDA